MKNHDHFNEPEEPDEDGDREAEDQVSVDEDVHHDESRRNGFDPEVARKLGEVDEKER